jgi:hypothetical protein
MAVPRGFAELSSAFPTAKLEFNPLAPWMLWFQAAEMWRSLSKSLDTRRQTQCRTQGGLGRGLTNAGLAESRRETALFDEQLIQGFLARLPEHGRTWWDGYPAARRHTAAVGRDRGRPPRVSRGIKNDLPCSASHPVACVAFSMIAQPVVVGGVVLFGLEKGGDGCFCCWCLSSRSVPACMSGVSAQANILPEHARRRRDVNEASGYEDRTAPSSSSLWRP